MSEMARSARAAMKAKASRMGGTGEPKAKVDASSWSPPEMMNTGAKVGMRPISRRAFKKGGKVIEKCEGGEAMKRADRKQRKAGGKTTSLVTDLINRNDKKANLARVGGDAHIGGYAKGGDVEQDKKLIKKALRQHDKNMHGGKHEEIKLKKGGYAKKQAGGKAIPGDAPTRGYTPGSQATGETYKDVGELIEKKGLVPKEKAKGGSTYYGGTRPTGGRMPRKAGGRAKGKTNIVIMVNPQQGGQQQQPGMPPKMPTPPPMMPPPVAPPAMGPGAPPPMPPMAPPPPGGMPGGAPGGVPPMPRKHGGRAGYADGGKPMQQAKTIRGFSGSDTPMGRPTARPGYGPYSANPAQAPVQPTLLPNRTPGGVNPYVIDPARVPNIPQPAAPMTMQPTLLPGRTPGGVNPYVIDPARVPGTPQVATPMTAQPMPTPYSASPMQPAPQQAQPASPMGGYNPLFTDPARSSTYPQQAETAYSGNTMGGYNPYITLPSSPYDLAQQSAGGGGYSSYNTQPQSMPSVGGFPTSVGGSSYPSATQQSPFATPSATPMPKFRKSGGRAYTSYKDMDAGALSGMGRLEKTEIEHGKRVGRLSGGRARSYKDMDAGSLSGMGRIEKTAIQKNRR